MNRKFWWHLIFLITAWMVSYGGTYLGLRSLGIAEQAYSNLIINTVFLLACLGCIRLLGLSPGDVGLKIYRQRLILHAGLSLAIFTMYWLYYLFGVRISGLRPEPATTTFARSRLLIC
jgi:hypothetical protein